MATVYEIARKLQMPGLEVQATFHPTKLTTRMFNSARKMIASGRIEGNGGAAKVAQVVLDSRQVSFVKTSKWGITVEGGYEMDEAAKQEVRDLIEAYIVVESAQRAHFDDTDRNYVRRALEKVLSEEYAWISMYNAEYRTQIADAFLKHRRPADLQNAQQLLTAFETGAPFPIPM
jgi:hypothetical protein